MKEEAQQKFVEFQMLHHQVQQMQKQMQALESQAEEMDLVQQALDDLSRSEVGSEMFVTMTPGVFVKAKLEDKEKVLLNVGGGAIVEKDVPGAKKIISEQGTELRKLHEELNQQYEKLTNRAEEIQREMQKLGE